MLSPLMPCPWRIGGYSRGQWEKAMNHKQKLGYIVLGAVIMLVGIGIGVVVSPPLIAQRNEVFGEIECTKLTVVDKSWKSAIELATDEDGSHIRINDKTG
jgi:hypothetical protein